MKFSFDSELFVASISSVETREPAGIFFFEFQQLFPVYSPSFSEILVGLAPLPWRFGGVWDPLSLSLSLCVCVSFSSRRLLLLYDATERAESERERDKPKVSKGAGLGFGL